MPAPRKLLLTPRTAAFFGLIGCAVLGLAMAGSALLYSGRIGEPYSPFNHFVSELGEVGITPGAWLFNTGLILCGPCFGVFMAGLASVEDRVLMRWAARVGGLAGVFAVLVGLFPVNILIPHIVVAAAFFLTCMVAVVLFSIVAVRSSVLPRWLIGVGLLPIVSYVVMQASLFTLDMDLADLPLDERRPDWWLPPIAEWVLVLCTVGWIVAVALVLWRRFPRPAPGGR